MPISKKIPAGFYWLLMSGGWTIAEVDFDSHGIIVDMLGSSIPLRRKDLVGVQFLGPICLPKIHFSIGEDPNISTFAVELEEEEIISRI